MTFPKTMSERYARRRKSRQRANARVEDTDTLDHAGENTQTLFSGM
jgi:hypothetical protein